MPCTLKIKIISARDLPVMDRQSKLTDAFVTIRLGQSHSYRTPIAYKTLHPTWNASFRIDVVDDLSLQDEPLLLTVWDKDYVTDDSIGTVMVDLNPLLTPDSTQRLYGWMPLYDTIHGIRGSIKASIKVEAFTDSIAKDTSASVTIYGVSHVSGYTITHIHGFVEELISASDPEYHWVDSFRASRVSNEQRQLLFNQLGAKVRRNVGRKAIELGANSVVAYRLSMDLEGEFGVVVRAMGTAVTIMRNEDYDDEQNVHSAQRTNTNESVGGVSTVTSGGNGANGTVGTSNAANAASSAHSSHSYRRDVHLLTMTSFPSSMHFTLGGLVSARAVKLLDSRGVSLTAEHDLWWTEVRAEVKAHAKRLNCSQVIGYREEATIHDDCVILSAYGTAARGGWYRGPQRRNSRSTVLPVTVPPVSAFKLHRRPQSACAILHIPYARTSMPFRMQTTLCTECGKRVVPEFILSTMEIASESASVGLSVPLIGRGQMIEARICRSKKRLSGEGNAIAVSELLPFIEYDLHRALVYKLRVAGCNGAFKIHSQLTLGDNIIVGTITATAVYIPLLPAPPPLTIKRYRPVLSDGDQRFVEAQNVLMAVSKRNRAQWSTLHRKWRRVMRSQRRYRRRDERAVSGYTPPRSLRSSKRRVSSDEYTDGAVVGDVKDDTKKTNASSSSSSSSSSSDHDSDKDSAANASNEVVLSVDDIADDDLMMSLIEPHLPANVALVNTESIPLGSASTSLRQRSQMSTANINVYAEAVQMLTAIKRIEWADDDSAAETVDTLQRGNRLLAALYHDVYAAVAYQLNAYRPCVLTGTVTQVSVVGLNSVQVICSGMILTAASAIGTHYDRNNDTSDDSATDSDSDSGDDSKIVRMSDSPQLRRTRERTAPNLKRAGTNGHERLPVSLISPPSTPSATTSMPALIPQLTAAEEERIRHRLTAHLAHSAVAAKLAHSRSAQHNGHLTPIAAPQSAPTPNEFTLSQRINSSPTHTALIPPPHTSAAAASLLGLFRSASTSHTHNDNGAEEVNDVRIAATMETLRSLAAINTDAPIALRPTSMTPTLSLPPPHWLQPQSSLTPNVTAAAVGFSNTTTSAGGVAAMSAHVMMTPLTLIPRYDIVAYRGRLRFTLIKEVWSVQSGGGLGVFIHTFLSELHAVMRSHCTSRGGNAVVGYVLDEIRVIEQNKTQAYSIVSVSGDCVRVEQSKQ